MSHGTQSKRAAGMASIERQEFENWMQVLREDIRGTHIRLDELNGRTRSAENEIAVLKDRGSRDNTARFAGVGSLLGGAVYAIYHALGSGK